MKNIFFRQSFSRVWLALSGVLLVALPTSVLIPGCGGGNSSNSINRFSAPVQFSASQTGTLQLNQAGNTIAGQLTVNTAIATVAGAAKAGQRSADALSSNIPAGTYTLVGTFSPPRGFSVRGQFPAPFGNFSISGQIPKPPSDAGSYTITVGGETVTGNFFTGNATATPTTSKTPSSTATATSRPMSTPVPSSNGLNLVYSNNSTSNVVPTSATIPFNFGTANIAGGNLTIGFQEAATNPQPRHALQFELGGQGALTAGKTYTLGAGYFELLDTSNNRRWDSQNFTIRLDTVSQTSSSAPVKVSFTILSSTFTPTGGSTATGTFNLTGTASADVPAGSGGG